MNKVAWIIDFLPERESYQSLTAQSKGQQLTFLFMNNTQNVIKTELLMVFIHL